MYMRSRISLKDPKALKLHISSKDQDSKTNRLTAISLYKEISIRHKIKSLFIRTEVACEVWLKERRDRLPCLFLSRVSTGPPYFCHGFPISRHSQDRDSSSATLAVGKLLGAFQRCDISQEAIYQRGKGLQEDTHASGLRKATPQNIRYKKAPVRALKLNILLTVQLSGT